MATRPSFQLVKEFSAAGDLSSSQYLFVEASAGSVSVCNAITDVPVGVLQNKPTAAGRSAEVCYFGGTKLIAGGSINAGDLLGTTTAGKAVALAPGTDTTAYVVGRALSASTGDGQVIDVFVDCVAPTRAA